MIGFFLPAVRYSTYVLDSFFIRQLWQRFRFFKFSLKAFQNSQTITAAHCDITGIVLTPAIKVLVGFLASKRNKRLNFVNENKLIKNLLVIYRPLRLCREAS